MNANVLSGLAAVILQKDFARKDGTLIPAGSEAVFLPQTIAQAVVMEDGSTLDEAVAGLRGSLLEYQTELVRLADRITAMQLEHAGAKHE